MVKPSKVTNLNIVKKKMKDSSKVSALSPREIVSELDRYVIGQMRFFQKTYLWLDQQE